jgi:hypothetical protein
MERVRDSLLTEDRIRVRLALPYILTARRDQPLTGGPVTDGLVMSGRP